MAASDSIGLAGWCAEEREPHTHDRGAKQRQAEPAAEPVDRLTVGLIMFGCNHRC